MVQVAKEVQYRERDDVVPCASKSYCRCPYLGDGDHKCSKCKAQVHIQCMGENSEGGGKLCAMCVSPNGLCDFAKGFSPPEPPSWYKPAEKFSSRTTPTDSLSQKESSSTIVIVTKEPTKENTSNKRKAADEETDENEYDPYGGDYLLVNPKGKKSPIWRHWLCFNESDHPELSQSAHCRYCPKILKAGRSGTGGMK